jgi:hypothetical protein
MSIESIAGDIFKAQVTQYGDRLTDGNYKLKVTKLEYKETRNKGPACIFNFEVVESTNVTVPTELLKAGETQPVAKTPGSKVAQVVVMKSSDAAPGNVKQILGAIMQDDFAAASQDVFTKAMVKAFSTNACNGIEVHANSWRRYTKAGEPFVGFTWTPVSAS